MTATTSECHQAAHQAHQAGLTVVPPRQDGTKAPDGTWRQYQTSRPTPQQIDTWYSNGRTGLGLVTGAASGHLEMLELEGRATHLWKPLIQACRDNGAGDIIDRIANGYAELTPSGGLHLLYRCTGPVDGNQKLARDPAGQVLIETRGEGGYVVTAPSSGSVHPTGKPWVLRSGGFNSIATITPEERELLLAVARMFDQMPPDEPAAPAIPQPAHEGDSWMDQVAHAYNTATSWAGLLGGHGWTHSHRHGQVDYWTRPGKNPKDGHSATTNANGTDRLIVFSSSVPGFRTADGDGPAPSYDRFGAMAVLQHAGDRLAAAVAAREAGHGPAPHHHDQVDAAGLRILAGGSQPAGREWPEPVSLGHEQARLPGFPIDVLPDWMRTMAGDVARQLQVPIDLPALLAIGAVCAVVHGKARINVADGWREHLNLYTAIAMPPSSGKSPAAKAMFAPVEELEAELNRSHQQLIAEATQRKKIAEKKAKDLEGKAAKNPDLTDEAVAAFVAAEGIEIPQTPRLLSDDATPEALTNVLAGHGGRITIASTEGGLFELMTGRYSDGRANLDIYLKAWSSDPVRVDRIGRPPVHIAEPVVSVALTVQPEVLRSLADRPELAGRGLTARFMYSMPADLVGHRDLTRPRDATHLTRRTYHDELLEIGRRYVRSTNPADLRLTPAAVDRYGAWRQGLEERRRPDGDLRTVAEWSGKLEASALRLAGLLHIADGNTGPAVDVDTLDRAIQVAQYWLAHALAVHDLWRQDHVLNDARAVIDWAIAKHPDGFKAYDLRRAIGNLRNDPDRCNSALERLVDTGWIRTGDGEAVNVNRGSGRPSQTYLVNPDAARSWISARSQQAETIEGT